MIGRYLSWSAEHLLKNLPPNLRVVIAVGHSFAAVRTERHDPAASLGAGIVTNPFPTHERLKALDSRNTVAIRGLGLTGLDVLAELTIGRGGRFEPTDPGAPPRYVASGDEPKIYMYSRSSCPVRARPDGSDGGGTHFAPVILTDDRAAQVLDGPRPIDFRAAVFPLILAEMTQRLSTGSVRGLAPEPLAMIRQWFADGGRGGATRRSAHFSCRRTSMAPARSHQSRAPQRDTRNERPGHRFPS